MIKYFAFAMIILLDAAGLILEKKGIMLLAKNADTIFSWQFLYHAVTNLYVVSGVFCVGIGLILWLYVLSQFNLSYIYPFGSVLYILVAVLSYFILGEPFTMIKSIGIGVIVLGCILINL